MRWPWQSKKRAAEQVSEARRQSFAKGYALRNFHNAAKTGRRTDKWGAKASGPNSASASDGVALRKRARHQTRNSPHAAKAKHLFVSSVVGDGIRPQIKTGDPALDAQAEALWAQWSERCDADGRNDFYGLQRLVASTIPDAGECIVRRRPRRSADRLPVPLQLQVMEADYIDTSRTQALRGNSGRIIQGVEFGPFGRRAAYWLFAYHPNDAAAGYFTGATASQRVPASEIAHVYHCDRPGQVRGLPWMAPIMMLLEDLEAYMDAEVLRKRVEACIVGVYKGAREQHLAPATDGESLAPITDADGVPMGDIQPGEFYMVDSDAELDIKQPTMLGGIEEFVRVVLRQVATGLGTTYELLAGDLSKVNFSSGRMGNIEWRRLARALSKVLIVRQFCQPTFDWWLTLAVASGALPEADYQVEWIAPHFEEVDREKDLKADAGSLASGLESFKDTLARKGKDLDQHIAQLALERQKLLDAGITVDWSPELLSSLDTPAVAPAPEPLAESA